MMLPSGRAADMPRARLEAVSILIQVGLSHTYPSILIAAPLRRGSARFPRRRLCLLEIEPHIHLAVHRGRRGEVLLRLLRVARAPVERAEAEVAVGDEPAHAKSSSKRERLARVRLSTVEIRANVAGV